jgi:pyruvate kinase
MARSGTDAFRHAPLTRIVATVGPASNAPVTLERLVRAGVSVFRLNMSHGDPASHAKSLAAIRRAADRLGTETAVLADLPGPKIRLQPIAEGREIALRRGQAVRFVAGTAPIDPDAATVTLRTDYPRLAAEARPGQRVLIDDGKVALRVRARTRGALECTCDVAGAIAGRKGVNLPDTELSLRAPTTRDLALARWAVRHGADFVALSFVEDADDLRALRTVLQREARRARARVPQVVAKIERPVALGNLGAIAAGSDALMVARGDLAVELEFARVPVAQRSIQAACDAAGIPCIVATQMLESMIHAPTPTRAEASDVANAVFGGADAVMLSGETAAGKYPRESVDAMRRIAVETERWVAAQPARALRATELAESSEPAAVLARSMAQMATAGHARAIVAFTDPRSVRYISQTDVHVPIYAFGSSDAELRSLALLRGVRALRIPHPSDSRVFVRTAERLLRARRDLAAGDRIVVATGFAGRGTERLWLRQVGARAV